MTQCATYLDYQETQPHEKPIPYDLPYNPWGVVHADIISINTTMLLCIIAYYKFPIMKNTGGLSTDVLIRATKIVFTEIGLPKKIVSDTDS